MESTDDTLVDKQRFVGNIQIKHKDIFIWCDTAYTYSGSNKVDAYGNVHINQADTLHLYANKIFYNGDIEFARAWENVKLVNKTTTLYSDTLDYNLANKIAYYDDRGKIVDSISVLTSVIGRYFVNQDLMHFYREVRGKNEKYTLESDTLKYNTKTGMCYIVGPTTIRDSVNTLYAEDGWYNTDNGEAELLKNPVVNNEKQKLTAKFIQYNRDNGNGKATGSVRIDDIENRLTVLGNLAIYTKSIDKATVTDSAQFVKYDDKDTLYLHADTLRSVPDTVKDERIVMAYRKVRYFRNDLQGICDSLIYFSKDSVARFYYNPVIWSEIHQLSADFIEMRQNTDKPDEIYMKNNSYIISEQDTGMFDQVKGKNMTGYIVNNEIDRIDVSGNGQTLYYAREEEDIIGMNRAESSNISIRFKEGKIWRIAFYKSPEGVLKPLKEVTEEDKKLEGFDWKSDQRPLSKEDIFRQPNIAKETKVEPAKTNLNTGSRREEL
jgi:lipopolysaccharide export system protein LptA